MDYFKRKKNTERYIELADTLLEVSKALRIFANSDDKKEADSALDAVLKATNKSSQTVSKSIYKVEHLLNDLGLDKDFVIGLIESNATPLDNLIADVAKVSPIEKALINTTANYHFILENIKDIINDDRQVACLFKHYGIEEKKKTYREIARELSISHELVKVEVHKAIIKLSQKTVVDFLIKNNLVVKKNPSAPSFKDLEMKEREIALLKNKLSRIEKFIKDEINSDQEEIFIEKYMFSTRTYNSLKRNYKTLNEVSRVSEIQLQSLRGIGINGVEEIKSVLKEYNFSLPSNHLPNN